MGTTMRYGPLTATTTTTVLGPFASPPTPNITFLLRVSAVSGTTPTLDTLVLWAPDAGGVNVMAAEPTDDKFAQITAGKASCKTVPVRGPFYFLQLTIGGTTPSFSASIWEFF